VVFIKLESIYKSALHVRNSNEARRQQIPVENKLDATLCACDSLSFYLFSFQSIEAFLVTHGNDTIKVTKTNRIAWTNMLTTDQLQIRFVRVSYLQQQTLF
jgi:hypothetical protein